MQAIGLDVSKMVCTDRCKYAKCKVCKCSCKGENHGTLRKVIVIQTMLSKFLEDRGENIKKDNFSIIIK